MNSSANAMTPSDSPRNSEMYVLISPGSVRVKRKLINASGSRSSPPLNDFSDSANHRCGGRTPDPLGYSRGILVVARLRLTWRSMEGSADGGLAPPPLPPPINADASCQNMSPSSYNSCRNKQHAEHAITATWSYSLTTVRTPLASCVFLRLLLLGRRLLLLLLLLRGSRALRLSRSANERKRCHRTGSCRPLTGALPADAAGLCCAAARVCPAAG